MKTYSHPITQQDLWVVERLGQKGTFCEVGAFDGKTHSNTLLLEELWWTGTLIEGHRPFYDLCVANRPHARCVNAFIGPRYCRAGVLVGGQYTGLIKAMTETWVKEHERRNAHRYTAECTPLIDYVTYVDYLSIDTEGGEYEILDAWFKAGGACRALTVEFRYDNDYLMKLNRLMEDNGLALDEIRGFDACYIEMPGWVGNEQSFS